jgi:hypothetical protein
MIRTTSDSSDGMVAAYLASSQALSSLCNIDTSGAAR